MSEVVKGADEKFCSDCGAVIKAKAEICPKCGCRQMGYSGIPVTSAGIIALLLGGLGIHKFYLGNSGMGILYLLFCWTIIPAVIAFIEAIIIFSQSQEAFDAKWNKPAN